MQTCFFSDLCPSLLHCKNKENVGKEVFVIDKFTDMVMISEKQRLGRVHQDERSMYAFESALSASVHMTWSQDPKI